MGHDDTEDRSDEQSEDEPTQAEVEAEREQRLDPENRPETAEVDNTERDFDHEQGMFTDREEYDADAPPAYPDDAQE